MKLYNFDAKKIKLLEKENLTLQYRIGYLEKQLLEKDRRIYKHLAVIMEIEEKWKAATKRAHTLQLENNRLKKNETSRS